MEALRVNRLSVKFGDFVAVNNISFSVEKGEIFGFLGANGAGKTTTIRVLCGLITPTQGEIQLRGVEDHSKPIELRRSIGYMSQKFTLWDDMSIEENLRFTSELHKMDPQKFQRSRDQLLGMISFQLETKTLVKDLPGGLKQQVSLVAALLHDPEIIFLDEPTAGVTPANRAHFWDLIRKITAQGKTVFVTTHYMDEAEHCDRVALMRSGEIVAMESPSILKKMAFPTGVLEIENRGSCPSQEVVHFLQQMLAQGVFSMLKPYGLRFHAEVVKPEKWQQALMETGMMDHIHVKNIIPSLEDVFIRMVEGTREWQV